MNYGYIRISSKYQNYERQLKNLTEYGIRRENIYIDVISGATFNRKNYKRLIRKIKEGDLIVIHELDRLGRNYAEIMENWTYITKKKKADIKILSMTLLEYYRYWASLHIRSVKIFEKDKLKESRLQEQMG